MLITKSIAEGISVTNESGLIVAFIWDADTEGIYRAIVYKGLERVSSPPFVSLEAIELYITAMYIEDIAQKNKGRG